MITPETPATGITKLQEWDSSVMFRVTCDCTAPDCQHTVDVEVEDNFVTVTTYTTQSVNLWSKSRWQHIWQLLTTGKLEYEAAILMSKQVALNYAAALQAAVKDIESNNEPTNS
jgi:hypothetical protein